MKRTGLLFAEFPMGAMLATLARPRVRKRKVRVFPAPEPLPPEDEFRKTAFTLAVIGLCATYARKTGVDPRRMALVFGAVFPTPAGEREKITRLFLDAFADATPPDLYARQIRTLFEHRPGLIVQVMERLFMLAAADGRLTDPKMHWLLEVAAIFRLPDATFWELHKRHSVVSKDPYAALGVPRDATNDDVRRAYRRLLREFHPDGLAAYGLAASDIAFAERKLSQINHAYDVIARRRGMK